MQESTNGQTSGPTTNRVGSGTVRQKLAIGAVAVMGFCAATSTLLLWFTLRSVSNSNLEAVTRNTTATAGSAVDDIQRRIAGYAGSLARRPEIAIAVSGGNVEALREMLVAEYQTLKELDASVSSVEATSRSGAVMMRGHAPDDTSVEPVSPSAVRLALKGEITTGLALSRDENGMVYSAVAPLRFASVVVGAVAVGSALSGETAEYIKTKTGAEIAFLVDGKVVASTLAGGLTTGVDQDLAKASSGSSDGADQKTLTVAGHRYQVGFIPLRSGDDQIAAVMAVFVSRSQVEHTARIALLRYLGLLGVSLLVIAWFVVSFANRFANPLTALADLGTRIASRDLRPVAVTVSGDDEIQRSFVGMSKAVESIRAAVEGIARHSTELGSASHQQSEISRRMLEDAEATSSELAQVSSAAEEMSANMTTAATSVEEMQASIREISRNTSEAATVAESAVGLAQRTSETINALGANSQKIDSIVHIITTIAEQTNLLALNATIESARAGEAGRGFSVVANEVKELARQTASATGEIEQQIKTIQSDSEDAVNAIAEISTTIRRISDVLHTIAVAVEQQTATTAEIGGNVTEVAAGGRTIAESIATLLQRAESTSMTAEKTRETAQGLDQLAVRLEQLVSGFKY